VTDDTVTNPFSSPVPTEAAGANANALAQREVAEVQAAMVIAKRFPRDPKASMDRILMACTRPTLADQAVYQYSRGGQDISGPSIRLAEELARGWGNILCGITELSRSNGVSECLAYAWDLESNFRDEKRFHVKHWRDTKKGGYALKDERDIYELISNQGARRKRACILAVIPGDVQETAVLQCDLTLKSKVDLTPERVESMLEKFAGFGVTKELIEKRIQRRIDALTPALFVQLGKIYNSLRDGMSKPHEWFEISPPELEPERKTLAEITRAAVSAPEPDDKPEVVPDRPPEEPAPTEAPAQPEPAVAKKPQTVEVVSALSKCSNIAHLEAMMTTAEKRYAAAGADLPRPVTAAFETRMKQLEDAK